MKLASSIATLLAGTGLAQVITIAALPVLTRLCAPDAFGVLAFFGAVAMLAGLVVTGRYELAVPIVESEVEAHRLVRLATTIGLTVAVAVGLAGTGFFATREPAAMRSLVWLAPSLLLTSLYQPLSYWFTRTSRFRAVSVSRVLQSVGTAAAQIAAGAAGFVDARALVLGALAGQVAATAGLEVAAAKDLPLRERVGPLGHGRSRALAREHRGFPQFTAAAGFLQLAAEQAPLLIIPFAFGSALAGTYALPARLLAAAVSLLSGSAAQAFYPEAAREHRARSLAPACRAMHESLLRFALVPIAVAAVVAPEAAALAFGDEWRESGQWFRLLVPWFVASLSFGPIAQVWLLLGRQRDALAWHAVVLGASVAALAVGARTM
ncbi:MAG: oligosaccharide flippase family protein, partial [Gemmatimonadetes bacterium]|nr:oligosaccharide flippase family protein [Gemmatimonadota bacterium]